MRQADGGKQSKRLVNACQTNKSSTDEIKKEGIAPTYDSTVIYFCHNSSNPSHGPLPHKGGSDGESHCWGERRRVGLKGAGKQGIKEYVTLSWKATASRFSLTQRERRDEEGGTRRDEAGETMPCS